ncbi:YoaK family protein [Streptomyces sp. NPDC094473]|uniref:YoaK family protein n=1 Tax=Streptomyces sp. NPDC094473 TaxID=3366068 RepID=UPI00382BED65
MPVTSSATSSERLTVVAMLLSFAAGAGDAFVFVQLGGVFTANMTGSLVLSGLTSRPAYGALLSGAATALGAFLIAVYLASKVAPRRSGADWRRVRRVMATVVALNVVVLIMISVSPAPDSMVRLLVLAASAAAMGAQTAVAKRAEPGGVTTTFVTGTLTSLAQDAADGSIKHAAVRLGVVGMLVLGALTASAVMWSDVRMGPAVAVVATALATLALPKSRPSDTTG